MSIIVPYETAGPVYEADLLDPLNQGLVFWGAGAPGGDKLLDLSAAKNDSNLTGTIGNSWTSGPVDGMHSFDFDGANDFARIPLAIRSLDFVLTYAAWVKFDVAPTGSEYVISETFLGVNNTLIGMRATAAGQFSAFLRNSASVSLVIDSPSVDLSSWTHVVVSSDGITCFLSINGLVVGTGSVPSLPVTFTQAVIAALSRESVTNFFNGNIADVRIYNRSLSAMEMATLYEQSLQNYPTALARTIFLPLVTGAPPTPTVKPYYYYNFRRRA